MPAFVNEAPAPSHILTRRFSVRPRKPIHPYRPAAFPPSTALCQELNRDYLLFLIGFAHYSVSPMSCQYIIMLNSVESTALPVTVQLTTKLTTREVSEGQSPSDIQSALTTCASGPQAFLRQGACRPEQKRLPCRFKVGNPLGFQVFRLAENR